MLIKIKRNGVIAINSILASFFLTGCGDDSDGNLYSIDKNTGLKLASEL